jgi:hypothetical protein
VNPLSAVVGRPGLCANQPSCSGVTRTARDDLPHISPAAIGMCRGWTRALDSRRSCLARSWAERGPGSRPGDVWPSTCVAMLATGHCVIPES